MSKQIRAITRAHDLAAQVDVQALHGGLPAHVSVTYERLSVDLEIIADMESHLCRMGYVTTRETRRETRRDELAFTVSRRVPK